MKAGGRELAGHAGRAAVSAAVMLVMQAALYLVAVRDTFRDFRRDLSAVQEDVRDTRCELAYLLQRPTLPGGCVIQQGVARP
jgi:hypothetical protein